MTAQAIPEGFRAITPYFTVQGIPRLIEFLKPVFEGEEVCRSGTPDGTVMARACAPNFWDRVRVLEDQAAIKGIAARKENVSDKELKDRMLRFKKN